jgi:predicted DNA-binding protein with PD1-like motif
MRTLRQPGPPDPVRIDAIRAEPREVRLTLPAGSTLADALTAPLVAAGFQCAAVTLREAALDPFRYVMPNPSPDDAHVAWFSATQTPPGVSLIEQANATFGWTDGVPSIHCHAVWQEPDGSRRGGHILPGETRLCAPAEARAWGFTTVRIDAEPDAETNFTLFQPGGHSTPSASGMVVRVKPNQDIIGSIETICRENGIENATVLGSLGSLVGARFTHGGRVEDHATEVLVRDGFIRNGVTALDLLVVDMQGYVHEGWMTRGDNPVCITFDLFLRTEG